MSLICWIPLINNTLNNQGLKNMSVTNNSATYSSSGGKLSAGCWSFSDGTKNGHGISIDKNFTDIGSNRSICAWVYPKGNHADYAGAIVSSGNWNSSRWSFGVERANGGFTGFDSGYSNYYSTSIPLNTWTHLCVTVANGVTKFYKNGVYLGEQSRGSGTVSSDASNTMVGRETYAGGYFGFNGSIQDVRIYDHCLTPQEVKEISKGLVAHYTLGSACVLPAITNYASNSGISGWNNSGTSSRNGNDTSHGTVVGLPVYSITCTSNGNCAITFSSKDATNLRNKKITASCWIYLSGNVSGNIPYLRSTKYDNRAGNYIANMYYQGNNNPTTWPKNTWIRIEGYGTVASDETTVYFCDYVNNNTEYRAYTGWLIEEYDIATPYIAPGTSRSTGLVYDSSGYSRNLTITGNVSPADSIRYDKAIYIANQNANTNYLTSGTAWSPSFITTGSISFWCKFNGLGSSGWLPFVGQSGDYWVLATSSGSGNFYHNNVGSATKTIYRDGIVVSAPSDNGNWHHYVITGINLSTWTIFRVNEYGGSWNSNMYVSDLRIYNTILSADDISDLYKLGAQIS